MSRKVSILFVLTALLLAVVPVLAQDFQIPEIVEGKWNVAFVLIGPINDGGWSTSAL